MFLTRGCWLTMLCVVALPVAGDAQDSAGIPTGTRIRVTLDGPARMRLTGRVIGTLGDSVYLRTWREGPAVPGAAVIESCALPLDGIRSLEVSDGTRNHAVTGLAIGAVAGAAVGGLAGALDNSDTRLSGGDRALAWATSFAAFGAATGVLIGRTLHYEVWVPAALAELPRINRGIGTMVTIRF